MPWFQTADGARLHYADVGTGRPALLLVHGLCGRLQHWEPQARAFSRRHRVVRLDLRGHGRSDAPPGRYARRDFVADLEAFTRRLRLRGAVVIGHSMGGGVVLDLVQRRPELARGVVLVDSQVQRPRARRLHGHPTVARLAGDDYEGALRSMLAPGLGSTIDPELAERILSDSACTPQHVTVAAFRNATLRSAPRAAWRRLRMPILSLNSSTGMNTPEAVRTALPQAQFAQVVASGHWLQLEVPAQCNAMIRRFIACLP